MKKVFSSLIVICLGIVFSFSAFGCGKKYIKGALAVEKDTQVLAIGEKVSMTAVFTPENPEEDLSGVTFQWHSNRTQVATVGETGLVTAVAPGVAKITVSYGMEKAECIVTVFDPDDRDALEVEFSRINVSNHQNKMKINLHKELFPHFAEGEKLVEILGDDGESISYTQEGDVVTLDWTGSIGMHNWLFCTASKVIEAEVCHATHILSTMEDFGPLSDDWDVATAGNSKHTAKYQNATKDWYVVLDKNINAGGGEDTSYFEKYSFGRVYAADATLDNRGDPINRDYRYAVFNGTFDGRGYSITGLNTQGGFIANLGTTGVIKNLALLDARNGRNFSCGVLGIYGLGKVENVFIEGYLKEWGGWSSGMYIRVDATHQLEVADCLVILRLYYSTWPSAATQMPAFFGSPLQKNPVKVTNSFGISEHLTQVDGAGTNPNGIVYKTIKEWLAAGGYTRFRGLWEIGQNNIFFGGQQVCAWED